MFDWLNGICSLRSFGIAGGVCSGISVFSHCVMGGRGYTGEGHRRLDSHGFPHC